MWCETIIRNLGNTPASDASDRAIDWVDLDWNECGRLLKKQTRGGQSVRVLLSPGQTLRHHDVIFEDERQSIALNVLPCEVVVAQAANMRELAMLALEFGNLHLPVQIENNQILFIEDGPPMSVLEAMGIRWTRQVRRFEPEQVKSAPAVEVAPDLRVTMRSRRADQEIARPE